MAKQTTSSTRMPIKAAGLILALWLLGWVNFFLTVPMTTHSLGNVSLKPGGIAVLTGGRGRLEAGLLMLENNTSKRLLVSGVHPSVSAQDLMRLSGGSETKFDCCIDLDRTSTNTIENAKESAQWVHKNNYQTLYLVTSDYHMPRSLLLFENEMPNVTIVPSPVETDAPLLTMIIEYNKYLFTAVSLLF